MLDESQPCHTVNKVCVKRLTISGILMASAVRHSVQRVAVRHQVHAACTAWSDCKVRSHAERYTLCGESATLPLMYLSLCELVILALQVCVGLALQLHLMLKVSLHDNRSLSRLHEALGHTLRAHHAAYGVITSRLSVMHADYFIPFLVVQHSHAMLASGKNCT